MLIPQFTLRWLLGLMTVGGCVFTVFGFAARGHAWAIGVSMALVSLAIVLLIHAIAFGLIWGAATVTARRTAATVPADVVPAAPESAPPGKTDHAAATGDGEGTGEAAPAE